MDNHGKIVELWFWISVETLINALWPPYTIRALSWTGIWFHSSSFNSFIKLKAVSWGHQASDWKKPHILWVQKNCLNETFEDPHNIIMLKLMNKKILTFLHWSILLKTVWTFCTNLNKNQTKSRNSAHIPQVYQPILIKLGVCQWKRPKLSSSLMDKLAAC